MYDIAEELMKTMDLPKGLQGENTARIIIWQTFSSNALRKG